MHESAGMSCSICFVFLFLTRFGIIIMFAEFFLFFLFVFFSSRRLCMHGSETFTKYWCIQSDNVHMATCMLTVFLAPHIFYLYSLILCRERKINKKCRIRIWILEEKYSSVLGHSKRTLHAGRFMYAGQRCHQSVLFSSHFQFTTSASEREKQLRDIQRYALGVYEN